jgi:UDP-N-acetylglucosamine 2-epimerase (non-hydrolysing)
VVSLHPHLADKMEHFGLQVNRERVLFLAPPGFFDFMMLERNARCVISDSGTVQEECCIFGIPNVTIRDVTERPETIECGSNILTGDDPDMIVRAVTVALETMHDWTPPAEYTEEHVSSAVVKIVLGYTHLRTR